MRIAVVGVVVGLVLVGLHAALGPSVGLAQRPGTLASAGGGPVSVAVSPGNERELVTVVDPDTRTMAVYHVDKATGEIVLKSVRNIHYDLKMVEFNGKSPLPSEIRAMLEQR